MRCERGHSITFRDRGPGRIHMANHGKPMNSCRVQFVVRNMDTKDKTLQINSVECKISDTRRITKVSELSEQNAETLTVSAFFVVSPPGRIRHFSALCREFCVSRRIVSRKTHDCESIVSHATHIAVSPLKMCVLRHSARTPLGYEGSRCQRWIPVSTTNRPYS